MKKILTLNDLRKIGNTVGYIKREFKSYELNSRINPNEVGFYFLVHSINHEVVARYFVGEQRCKNGIFDTLNQILRVKSQNSQKLKDLNISLYIVFVPLDKIKPLTNGYQKGQLSLALTRQYKSYGQSIHELNRMLNDNFKFLCQKY